MLTFNPETHAYTYAGRSLISVTQALQESGLVNTSFYTDEAALRGTHVHQALQYLDEDDLHESSVAPQLAGYIEAYRAFLRECELGPVLVNEERLADPVLGYAGTIDRIRRVGDSLAVLDIKTGYPCAWHGIQAAAYLELARQAGYAPTMKRFGLYLRPYGTYQLTPFTERSDWTVFKAALTVAQFRRRHG